MVITQRWDYRRLRLLAPTFVLVSLGLLLLVLAIGPAVNGARRWISIGPAVFQPSEFAKLALAVWAAAYLARHPAPRTLKELARRWKPELMKGIPKEGKHEALADILESIDELRYYRANFLRL